MRKREKSEQKKKRFTSKMQASLLLVFCTVIVFFIILIGRLFYLNSTDGERYKKSVLSQQSYTYNLLPYKRGDITDRNGTVLAKSVKVYNLVIDASAMLTEKKGGQPYVDPTIKALVKAFNVDEEKIRTHLKEKPNSKYYVYQKGYSYEQVKSFKDLTAKNDFIKGVWFEDDYVRTYPYETLASKTLGFTFTGNVGNSGIEGYYNDELNGTNGATYGYYNSENNVEDTVKQPTNGNNVISTLDVNIQKIVQDHVDKFNKEIGSKENTSVIVMDPNSGEILSMAESVTYDSNNPTDLSKLYTESQIKKMSTKEQLEARNKLWRNSIISNNFEPGSTIKALTVAAALDEGIVHDGETFICDGYEKVANNPKKIYCAKRSGHGKITLDEVLAYSCNDAIMQISKRMGPSLYVKYQTDFSLGKQSGIDLPGEAVGQVYNEDTMKPTDLATSSFGQSMSVPMIQVASAFASVINGGYYYTPHVVKQITTENGSIVRNVKSEYTRQVVSEETSKLVRNYMRETVTLPNGTAKNAEIKGYTIAGKTGTAEKFPRGKGNYVVSFMGYAPANDPQVLVYVTIDEPKGEGNASRSALAVDLARDIMQDIFPYLNVFPTTTAKPSSDKKSDKTESTSKPTATAKATATPKSTKAPKKEEEEFNYSVMPE